MEVSISGAFRCFSQMLRLDQQQKAPLPQRVASFGGEIGIGSIAALFATAEVIALFALAIVAKIPFFFIPKQYGDQLDKVVASLIHHASLIAVEATAIFSEQAAEKVDGFFKSDAVLGLIHMHINGVGKTIVVNQVERIKKIVDEYGYVSYKAVAALGLIAIGLYVAKDHIAPYISGERFSAVQGFIGGLNVALLVLGTSILWTTEFAAKKIYQHTHVKIV